MVFNKGANTKKRPRKFQRKRKTTVKSVARKVDKIVRNQELKFVDVNANNSAINNAGQIFLLNPIPVTPDTSCPGGREGHEVVLTSLQYRIRFRHDVNVVDITAGIQFRYIIFMDRQSNGATPAASQFLGQSLAVDNFLNPYNHDNMKRFKILEDRYVNYHPTTLDRWTGLTIEDDSTFTQVGLTPYSEVRKGYHKLGSKVKFDGDTGDESDIVTNSLWMFICTSGAAAPNMTIELFTRVYFRDN